MNGDHQENTNHGSGQSVNVHIGLGPTLILAIIALVVIAALVITTRAAAKSEMQANRATQTADSASNEFRMTQFWLQRVSLACQNDNRLPSVPAALLK